MWVAETSASEDPLDLFTVLLHNASSLTVKIHLLSLDYSRHLIQSSLTYRRGTVRICGKEKTKGAISWCWGRLVMDRQHCYWEKLLFVTKFQEVLAVTTKMVRQRIYIYRRNLLVLGQFG